MIYNISEYDTKNIYSALHLIFYTKFLQTTTLMVITKPQASGSLLKKNTQQQWYNTQREDKSCLLDYLTSHKKKRWKKDKNPFVSFIIQEHTKLHIYFILNHSRGAFLLNNA